MKSRRARSVGLGLARWGHLLAGSAVLVLMMEGCGTSPGASPQIQGETGGKRSNESGGKGSEATGGEKSSSGGNDTSSGGTRSSSGGDTSSSGGTSDSSGGTSSASGGTSSSSGGNTSSGGIATSGGTNASSGGTTSPSGGITSSGGTNASSGGSPSTTGGQTSATGGGPVKSDCLPSTTGSVSFSVPSKTFTGTLSVTLSTEVGDAEIRYTVNGGAPTATDTLYAGSALEFTHTTRLQAQVFVGGEVAGVQSTALYVARGFDATHDLPVMVLDAYGHGALSTTDRSFVDVGVLTYNLAGSTATLSSDPSVASLAAFHVRGQSSAMFPKIPYRLELRKETGDDRNCTLFGMPAESDWALVGPYADKTLIHNAFVYELGREIGLQAPRLRLIELYVNVANRPLEASDYQGVYTLVETIKNQKDRLNLQQLKPDDLSEAVISGGYIFKFEWMATEEPLLECPGGGTTCWTDMELVDPNPFAQQQKDYLIQHLVAFNDAMHSATPSDASTGYPSYIDVRSFIDHIIIHEFGRNMDAYVRSQYFYKDRGGKIFAGPLWDYDLIAGVGMEAGGFGGTMANIPIEGWQYEGNASRMTADWFEILLADPQFKTELVARWRELRQGPLSDASVSARIDALASGLANAADRNFQKWNILSQKNVNPFVTPTDPTWAGQLETMRKWLKDRAAWIDTQWQ